LERTGLKSEKGRRQETRRTQAEIPGVEQKDVSVLLENHVLTIQGERHKEKEKEEKDKKYRRVERSWGAFLRSIALPAGVDTARVNATFKDGVLTIPWGPRPRVSRAVTSPRCCTPNPEA
jgi:HSP20 family protein